MKYFVTLILVFFFGPLLFSSCKTSKAPLMQVGASGNLLFEGDPVIGNVGTVHKLFCQRGKPFGTNVYMILSTRRPQFKKPVDETIVFYLFGKSMQWKQVAVYTEDAYDRITAIRSVSEQELEVAWDGGKNVTKIKL